MKQSIEKTRFALIERWSWYLAVFTQPGWTALHCAADNGYLDILHVLVMERECDVAVATKVN